MIAVRVSHELSANRIGDRMSEFSAKQQEVDRNFEFFKGRLPDLLKSHVGKYALLRHQEVIGFYDTVVDAQLTGMKFYQDGMFSVQQVSNTAVDLGYYSHAVPLAQT
jgi:preprotein translocase subunit SecD